MSEEFMHRLFGAVVFCAIALPSWWGSKATSWEEVKLTVKMETVFPFVGALVALWGLLTGGLPSFFWLLFLIMAVFWIIFLRVHLKYKE